MTHASSLSTVNPNDVLRLLQNRLPEKRIQGINLVNQLGSGAVEYLNNLKGLVNDIDQNVRKTAATAICQLGEVTLPAMARMLSHSDKYVRRQAVWGLGKIGIKAKPVLADLCKALKDADPRMAAGAAQTIGGMGETAAEAIPDLVAAMRGTNVVICRLAAKALSQIGQPAMPALLADLQNQDIFVRGEAATAIGWMGPPAIVALPLLIEITQIPSMAVAHASDQTSNPSTEDAARAAAVTAIGRMGKLAASAKTVLIPLLADPSTSIRAASEQAIRMIENGV